MDLQALAEGTLSVAEFDEARSHVASCPRCREAFETTQHVDPRHGPRPDSGEAVTVSGFDSPTPPGDSVASAGSVPGGRHLIDGYDILAEIYTGGQGAVFKAVQQSTGRVVALKILPGGREVSAAHRHRFDREIRLAAALKHPNIVTVFESGVSRHRHYFAMEYISGDTLDIFVQQNRLSVTEVLTLFSKVCAAVGYAHQKGVLHRDLKPGNILVDSEGEPHVLDFGLAKSAATDLLHDGTPVTMTREFLGTIAYASPEQIRGELSSIDVRSDVYSLGAILYKLLTGEYPCKVTGDWLEVVASISAAAPIAPSKRVAHSTVEIDTVVLRALSKEPARRYLNALELHHEIERIIQGEPIFARRDSVAYLISVRTRRWATRNAKLVFLGTILVAVILAQHLIRPLIFDLTRWNNVFERFVTSVAPGPVAQDTFDFVRVVALTDETDVGALAREEGITSVDPGRWTSVRKLHGRMMEYLVEAKPRCVVWDIAFVSETEFDADLARGFQALQAAGIPCVVSVVDWWRDEKGLPRICPTAAPLVRWGSPTGAFDESVAWRLDLVMQRPGQSAQPSLVLASVAAYHQPLAEAVVHFDVAGKSVELSYYQTNPDVPGARIWLEDTHCVPLSSVATVRDASPGFGLREGDVVGYYVIHVAETSELNHATINYEDVLSAPREQRREWFADKVVVAGDLRRGIDVHPHADGRMIPGCYAHSAGIEALLRQTAIRTPGWVVVYVSTALAALIGIVWARLLSRNLAFVLAVLFSLALLPLVSIGAYGLVGYLWNPAVPACALLTAGVLGRVQRRVVWRDSRS